MCTVGVPHSVGVIVGRSSACCLGHCGPTCYVFISSIEFGGSINPAAGDDLEPLQRTPTQLAVSSAAFQLSFLFHRTIKGFVLTLKETDFWAPPASCEQRE